MKKFILPAAVILMGAGAAFATNVAKNSKTTATSYRIGSLSEEPCMLTPKECNQTGVVVCTWFDGANTHNLYEIDGTVCGTELFEIEP
ncbi:MAG: DUF6520 family protein [Chryseobacterium sp.]|uniref:DUF6520 family protein n=1 Tax=Chryseobacterium sp. TaxID=1871047 RepID=UPI0025C11E71|nr:DUF6520 family protein [Chryseobacterium sp.]MCJ7935969.1 DUF6520 family protein [Chryseobacterium sp.]